MTIDIIIKSRSMCLFAKQLNVSKLENYKKIVKYKSTKINT